ANTAASLRSPMIDLTGNSGPLSLSFWEYLDMDTEQDASGYFHTATVRVLDAGNLEEIVELFHGAARTDDWRFRQFQLPSEAMNRQIVVEFYFESDGFGGGEYDGWFI